MMEISLCQSALLNCLSVGFLHPYSSPVLTFQRWLTVPNFPRAMTPRLIKTGAFVGVRGGGAFGMRAALETEGAEEGVRLYGAGKNRSTLLM